MAGKLVHFEVPAEDTSRVLAFYGKMFGWQFQKMEGPTEYHMGQVDETMGAGVHRADEGGGIPGIFVYFDVDDIKAGVAQVQELGGKAEDPDSVPGMGWYARCADTEGNRFGLWQSDPSAPPPAQ